MNRRHFLIYYDNRTLEITKTTPRTWPKANQAHFPGFLFINGNHPTVDFIENYLTENYQFTRLEYEDFVVVYNFNPTIPPNNGLNFIL